MQKSYVYPGNYTPSIMELTQARTIGVPTLFINRVVSEKEKKEAEYIARVEASLPILRRLLIEAYRKNPNQNTLFHKEGMYCKEKQDITLHIYNESEVGVFREETDLGVKLLAEALKSNLHPSLFHLSTIK